MPRFALLFPALFALLFPVGPARADQPTASLRHRLLATPSAPREILFAVRAPAPGGHWYENFGHDAKAQSWLYSPGPSRLCRLNLQTLGVTTLLDDPRGGIRDPHLSYDGRHILFSYRPGPSRHYHLHTLNLDGSNLRRITPDDDFDDLEPIYTPSGDIIFTSSRCRSYVPCWFSQVAVLYRCSAAGENLRPISTNFEQENTPAILPDGRVLYMRWEYIDRDQLAYHHLWAMNPDGAAASAFYGNMHGGGVFIDAQPIPRRNEVLMVFSPGHGQREHMGRLALVNPSAGPDEKSALRYLTDASDFRDPFPLTPDLFIAARANQLLLIGRSGAVEPLYRLTDSSSALWVHEPRPIQPRPREPILPSRVDPRQTTGTLVLADVTRGRNMAGVRPGEIRSLLVLEPLPKPVNFNGWEDTLSYERGYIMHRILGTVPVEPDGSAHFTVPAQRPLFFVALDENHRSVKRMRSFTSVMPGETAGCVGCHEPRSQTPAIAGPTPLALRRTPSSIAPIPGVPDVLDFPRDIQPILDRHCIRCHNYDAPPPADLPLIGARGPWYSHSYYALLKNGYGFERVYGAPGNDPPRLHGSATSHLLKTLDKGHCDITLSPREQRLLRLWIDTGSQYCGTYAALGTGVVPLRVSVNTLLRRCASCHPGDTTPPAGQPRSPLRFKSSYGDLFYQHLSVAKNFAAPDAFDAMRRELPFLGDHASGGERFYNLTDPQRSPILLAPLARTAGGWAVCGDIFRSAADPDYQRILSDIRATQAALNEIKRFDMPGFRPSPHYLREMIRYGILPRDLDPQADVIDPYDADQRYWRSFWPAPVPVGPVGDSTPAN